MLVGRLGNINERFIDEYSLPGERKVGEEFQFNDEKYVVVERDTLEHEGRKYNCACFRCDMQYKCTRDFLYCSGECWSNWRSDSKSVFFKKVMKEEK